MRSSPATARRRRQQRQPHSNGGDPLAYVKADELRALQIDLDEAHSDLMGRALGGDNGAYQLGQIVKTAADFVAELRFGGQH